jgi:hypothetical protein
MDLERAVEECESAVWEGWDAGRDNMPEADEFAQKQRVIAKSVTASRALEYFVLP